MYGVMRFEKYKRSDVCGIEKERKRLGFHGRSDIDPSRSDQNIERIESPSWTEKINEIIDRYKVQTRKNSVVMVGGVFTASPEFFADLSRDEMKEYFAECEKLYIDVMCGGRSDLVISSRVDLDETTPHLQIYSVPIVESENGFKLSAKELFGSRQDLRDKQDLFHEQIGKHRGFDRGEMVDWTQEAKERKKHEKTHVHKQKQRKELDAAILALRSQRESLLAEISAIDKELERLQKKVDREVDTYQKTLDANYSLKRKSWFDGSRVHGLTQEEKDSAYNFKKSIQDLRDSPVYVPKEITELQRDLETARSSIRRQDKEIKRLMDQQKDLVQQRVEQELTDTLNQIERLEEDLSRERANVKYMDDVIEKICRENGLDLDHIQERFFPHLSQDHEVSHSRRHRH